MIESITLTDFRNHISCRVQTYGRGNVIITGPNGAGKTALIEAVSMLSGTRGLRGSPANEIARFGGTGGYSVYANLSDDVGVSVSFTAGDTNRRARIDGAATPLSDLAGRVRIVWLTPREDRLFVEGASERRAFFDRLAAGFDAAHAGRVARLAKLLSERAFALKAGRDSRLVDAIDAQIAPTAVAVAAARLQYAGEINFFLAGAAVSVSGMLENMLLQTNAAAAEAQYLQYLGQNREIVGDKMVLDGPHKSDFVVYNNDLKLPANLTSTGQQKTVLVNLILAHAKLVHAKTGANPIVLLDEADAHLDADARRRMFDALGDAHAQVWATGLDADIFRDVRDSVFVTCQDGMISNILVPEDM